MLSAWVNPTYLDKKFIATFARAYKKATPYPHGSLPNFLRSDKAKLLEQALREHEFQRKESDLFCFFQTGDLLHSNHTVIKEVVKLFRSKEFTTLFAQLTGERLSGNIDMMGALYKDTDYLLCHDDELDERKIAYVLSLSRNFTPTSGGALALLDATSKGRPRKVVKRLTPQWNCLNFFTVSTISHHMVEEVLQDKERLALTGWLHE